MRKVSYTNLNARQQENYNFQKISSILADYGFSTIRLNDDWQGADFIANHIDGKTFLKVQLKGRFTIDKKYIDNDIWICFPNKNDWYLFPHDKILSKIESKFNYFDSLSWKNGGGYSIKFMSKKLRDILIEYKL